MTQPSLFSAETLPPEVADLGGLLATHGQLVQARGGARLSILLAEEWRARSLEAECALRGVRAEASTIDLAGSPPARYDASRGTALLRTELSAALGPVARSWTKGAVKAVPVGLTPSPGFLRIWALAAGSETEAGYELGLDPHAVGTHDVLAEALRRSGIPATVVGRASATPVLRVTGLKRRRRLAEMLGEPPTGALAGVFPSR